MKTSGRLPKDRIIWLHERIRCGGFPNAQREAERFGISERQAHRDIRLMREELGAPLAFDRSRNGFFYTSDYSLPDYVKSTDAEEGVSAIAFSEETSGISAQMTIPYTAEIEVPSKLAATELGVYVKRKTGKNRYLCEFRNPGLFMGMLLASGERIRIVRPQWLKKRFAEACLALAEVNGAFSESD